MSTFDELFRAFVEDFYFPCKNSILKTEKYRSGIDPDLWKQLRNAVDDVFIAYQKYHRNEMTLEEAKDQIKEAERHAMETDYDAWLHSSSYKLEQLEISKNSWFVGGKRSKALQHFHNAETLITEGRNDFSSDYKTAISKFEESIGETLKGEDCLSFLSPFEYINGSVGLFPIPIYFNGVKIKLIFFTY